ncbi:MAG: orotate phosphoribosyltransferase [Deltaproteobacteria bacterium]|nr:orotate phosphoribosyltransferase [Deltaproteobacteria bacterium]
MKRYIAKTLLEIGAVNLNVSPPFTWASGRLSPIYCDNRLLMSFPDRRLEVARGFRTLIEENDWNVDVVAGTATAGIPHAAWLADILGLPMVYVRGAAKQHGKGNRIEGKLERGQKVVLIEDLISTGGSSVNAAKALIDAGAELCGVAAIFTYGLEKATQRFQEAGIQFATLTDFGILMEEALETGSLTPATKAIIADWQNDPGAWSTARGGAG